MLVACRAFTGSACFVEMRRAVLICITACAIATSAKASGPLHPCHILAGKMALCYLELLAGGHLPERVASCMFSGKGLI
jgi:hypothetical protein